MLLFLRRLHLTKDAMLRIALFFSAYFLSLSTVDVFATIELKPVNFHAALESGGRVL